MKKRIFPFILFLFCAAVFSAQQEIPQEALPEAVRTSFERKYPQAEIIKITKEQINDTLFYKVESSSGDSTRTIVFLPDGAVYQTEEQLSIADLPQTVLDTLNTYYYGDKITGLEKIIRNCKNYYQIRIGEDTRSTV